MVLLLGATGYVGSVFRRDLTERGVAYRAPVRAEGDYGHPEVLERLLEETRPSLVINAAGYTGIPNVEAAERQKPRCLEANLSFPVRLLQACQARGLPLGHVSTGCIYSGRRPDGAGWTEADEPNFDFRHNNSSFYSGCKALAEELMSGSSAVWIWRLRRPFNGEDHPRNYLSKISGYPMHLESENSLSQMDEFVSGCLDLALNRAPAGIYNLTNPGVVRTSEILALLLKYGGIPGPPKFFSTPEEYRALAGLTPRSECVLNSAKALSQGVRLTPVHEALEKAVQSWCGHRGV